MRRPNGAHASPSSTARRSDRAVRPPTHKGTWSWTAWGSTRKLSNEKWVPWYDGSRWESAARERAHRVVGHRAPIGELCAQERELLLERSRADAEHDASSAHRVERSIPFRDRQRVVVSEHQHEGGEPDRGRARSEVPEDRERIPVRAAPYLGDGDGHRDVLAARAELVPESFGRGDHPRDLVDPGVRLPPRVGAGKAGDYGGDDAEPERRVHRVVLPRRAVTRLTAANGPERADRFARARSHGDDVAMSRLVLLAGGFIAAVAFSAMVSGCGAEAAPDLERGGAVYAAQCATCHGASGEGGDGPSLAGIATVFETAAGQEAFVKTGGGGMPVFARILSDDEIRDVVAYTRERFRTS